MSFTRRLSREDWMDRCYGEIARLSFEAGFTLQEARDGAVLIDKLLVAIGEREPSNVVSIAEARAAR